MFHVRDGLFFERAADGGVRILKHETASLDSPVVLDVTVDGGSWASVVASVSRGGEDGRSSMRTAVQFLRNLGQFLADDEGMTREDVRQDLRDDGIDPDEDHPDGYEDWALVIVVQPSCGHPRSASASDAEGTNHCGACAEAARLREALDACTQALADHGTHGPACPRLQSMDWCDCGDCSVCRACGCGLDAAIASAEAALAGANGGTT